MSRSPARRRERRSKERRAFEVEVIPGLEALAVDELLERLRHDLTLLPALKAGLLPIQYGGPLQTLLELDTVLAVYLQRHFPVPRPRALLGHEYWTQLGQMIETVRSLHPPDA